MTWLVIGSVAVLVVGLVWRVLWLRTITRRETIRIPAFRYRPGMERFDPDLRDRTRDRRQAHEQAVTDLKRQLDRPKTKLHRVS